MRALIIEKRVQNLNRLTTCSSYIIISLGCMDSSVMSLPKPNYTLLIQIYTQHNNSKPVCNCNNCLAIRASPRASQLCCLLRTSPRQRTRVISLSGVVFRLRCGAWYSRYLATGSPRNRCLKTTHNASTHDDNDSCPDNYQPDPSPGPLRQLPVHQADELDALRQSVRLLGSEAPSPASQSAASLPPP